MFDIVKAWNGQNCVFTFDDNTNDEAIYSYVSCEENSNKITDIKEKVKISNKACTGAYGFSSINQLEEYTSKIIKLNKRQKSEFYTSGVIKEMLNDDIHFKEINIDNRFYFSLGTPKQVDEYENPYIFDLDGTLVDTDNIYVDVWSFIMKKYNLAVDSDFFKYFIQGKNDFAFLKHIFSEIDEELIEEISNLKDNLFVEYLGKHEKDITIPGTMNFFEKNKNRRMCIVTSSNKVSAEYICKYTGIEKYIQFLISSEDCRNHKPDKEPYQRAINILKVDKNKCTIFEDSNSGFKSAKSLGGAKICLILNDFSSNFIKNSSEYKIKNYHEFNCSELVNLSNNIISKDIIINNLKDMPIKDVIFLNDNIKTGYICDIKKIKLILNYKYINLVMKIENDSNELSNVARNINLYNNEVYFYEYLSNIVNISSPKYYSSFKIDDKNIILLENLNYFDGCFDLQIEGNIDLILLITKKISELHNMFYFKKKEDIISPMKNLLKINEISYYINLINIRFDKFLEINNCLLSKDEINILTKIKNNYDKLLEKASTFPLNFCHGDLKSPNIFYQRNYNELSLIFLDWQYIHLNKGISDITFLLVESTKFNSFTNDLILKYYYCKSNMYNNYEELILDFKISLCIFPFFVLVWFNSEDRGNILDKVFPIRFMKNLLKFYNYYLNENSFDSLLE